MKTFLNVLIVIILIMGFIGLIYFIADGYAFSGYICLFISIQLAILIYIPQLAMSKGYSGILAFLLAFFIPLFGSLIIIALLPDYNTYHGSTNTYSNINLNNITPSIKPSITGDTWTCKKCGEKNRMTASSCSGCGAYK